MDRAADRGARDLVPLIVGDDFGSFEVANALQTGPSMVALQCNGAVVIACKLPIAHISASPLEVLGSQGGCR